MPFDSLPQTNDVIEKLVQIKELLSRKYGWAQYITHRKLGELDQYCLLGAADYVELDKQTFATALGFKTVNHVHRWNDQNGRRQETVIKRLDTAIANAQAKLSV